MLPGTLNIACPNCFAEIALPASIHAGLSCPACALALSKHELEMLHALAAGVSFFAWQYGNRFLAQVRQTGKVETHYKLEPIQVLTYLASVIAAGILGNAAYDIIKNRCLAALRAVRRSQSLKDSEWGETDDLVFEKLTYLAKGYVDHRRSPFFSSTELGTVFNVIEFEEPSRFLTASEIDALVQLFTKYERLRLKEAQADRSDNIDYLGMLHALRTGYSKQIFSFVEMRAFAQIADEVRHALSDRDIDKVHEINSHALTGFLGKWQRHLGMLFELIENSILAVRNQHEPEVHITVRGSTVVVQDNGPGMTSREMFQYLLQPDVSGWQHLGVLQHDQTYDRCGLGVTGGLMWCESLIVDSQKDGAERCSLELTIRNLTDIALCARESKGHSGWIHGTRVAINLCLHPRDVWREDGPNYRELWNMPVGEVESFVIEAIKDFSCMVDDSVTVLLNNDRVNSVANRGVGPLDVVVGGFEGKAFKDHQSVHIDVYSAPTPMIRAEPNWEQIERDLRCWIELYQNGLLISRTWLQQLIDSRDLVVTPFQAHRLTGFVLRCFLPCNLPLSVGKSGLPADLPNTARIASAIISLISPERRP